jgi:hypothetical protein
MRSRPTRHPQTIIDHPQDTVIRITPDQPEHIPLLEDVVFAQQSRAQQSSAHNQGSYSQHKRTTLSHHLSHHLSQAEPRSTDLFPQIVVLNNTFEAAKLQADVAQIADHLVNAHPECVIRKLRDELSLLLDELDDSSILTNRHSTP